jgi:enolase
MAMITAVFSREILDSRGNPTVEVDVLLDNGIMGRAAVPSGASTGAHEAVELRDGDKKRYGGKGVQKAVKAVNTTIADEVVGLEVFDQEGLDKVLRELDGTENKANLGANAILGVSLAAAKAAAQASGLPLYRYVGGVAARRLPVPLMNILNGGAHADNGLDVQEFMIAPIVGGSFKESLRAGAEVFHTLKAILGKKGLSTGVGDEGGFAPRLKSNREAMELVTEAISAAGYSVGKDMFLALDVAATELYEGGKYRWEGGTLTGEQLGDVYRSWAKDFSLVSIEDGFSEDDWGSWVNFTGRDGGAMGSKLQIVGDDLFVTNPKRVARGIKEGAANALLVKVNQIGTLSETCEAVQMAAMNKMHTIMSHRSGETEDATIADLAVALQCQQIKTGSLCRGERTAKYNQLLRIEEDLGASAQFWGRDAFFEA